MSKEHCITCGDKMTFSNKGVNKIFCGVKCRNKHHNQRVKDRKYAKRVKPSLPVFAVQWGKWTDQQKLIQSALCSSNVGGVLEIKACTGQ